MRSVLNAALETTQAGWAVTPLIGKQPVVPAWTQQRFPRGPECYEWFDEIGYEAFGVRCGAISGGLVVIDIEGRLRSDGERFARILTQAKELGVGQYVAEAATSASAETPSGGWHWFFRVREGDDIPRNLKLAYAADEDGYALLAEVRGEGGQVAVPPGPGRRWLPGSAPGNAVEVSRAQLDLIFDAFRAIDEAAGTRHNLPPKPRSMFTTPASASVADVLASAVLDGSLKWSDILDPGWSHVGYDNEGRSMWLRPDYGNKPTSLSSAHGYEQHNPPSPVLVVHSSAVPHLPEGPGQGLTPGRVLAASWFGGHENSAYAALENGMLPEGLTLPQQVRDAIAGYAANKARRDEPVDVVPAPPVDGAPNVGLEEAIKQRAVTEYITAEARERVQRIRAGRDVSLPDSTFDGAEYLALPDEGMDWALDGLLPSFGNATLTASFKAGKTSTMGELVRSLCDGVPFLGKFTPTPMSGRVALWNYELGRDQQKRWLRDVGIDDPHKFAVLDLRGSRFPLVNERVETLAVEWLAEREVEWWIVDPFARAFVGCGDENSNADVSVFLDTLDVIKQRSGVKQIVMPVHTGRPGMMATDVRARGAARLDDWPDARWMLFRDEDTNARFFSASGRDVDVDEEQLVMDDHKRLRMGGWDREGYRMKVLTDQVCDAVNDSPGITRVQVQEAVQGRTADVRAALDRALGQRLIVQDENGGYRSAFRLAGE